jgi:D-arabinose 1-dehydrogenase-like Zn-dependent alcohol dehydrogenase
MLDTQDHKVVMIGAGAGGGFIALGLAKAGIKFTVIDFDTVEEKNVQNQIYSTEDIGRYKSAAISYICDAHSPKGTVRSINSRYEREHIVDAAVIILAVDSIRWRKAICNQAPRGAMVFDTRLGGQIITAYAGTPAELLQTMDYTDDEVVEQNTCHAPSSTIDTVMTAAGLTLTNIFTYLSTGTPAFKTLLRSTDLSQVISHA